MAERLKTGVVERPLKRLLQHRESRCYFNGDGWTDKPNEAKCFSDQLEAVRDCVGHDLRNVELVLRFDPEGTDVFSTSVR